MSRQNKVNPGMYTQRGRLTQDDAARELKRQRSIGSEHTWQPSKKDHFPRLTSNDDDAALREETSGDNESAETPPTEVNAKPAAPVARTAALKKAAASKKAAPAKAKPSKMAKSTAAKKKTAGKARAAKAAKPAAKRATGKATRKAVLARNVGGGGAKPRPTAKRRKS